MTGYSGTPLAKKLGLKPGSRVVVLYAPTDYRKLLAPIPDGVRLQSAVSASTDIVHLFVTSRAKLAQALNRILTRLRPDAAIWVSWPKKASNVPTDVTEDVIRDGRPLIRDGRHLIAVSRHCPWLRLLARRFFGSCYGNRCTRMRRSLTPRLSTYVNQKSA